MKRQGAPWAQVKAAETAHLEAKRAFKHALRSAQQTLVKDTLERAKDKGPGEVAKMVHCLSRRFSRHCQGGEVSGRTATMNYQGLTESAATPGEVGRLVRDGKGRYELTARALGEKRAADDGALERQVRPRVEEPGAPGDEPEAIDEGYV